jgi:hypothetical protein
MAAEHFQQRGFAGTVMANQASDFSGREGQRERMQQRAARYAKGRDSARRWCRRAELFLHSANLIKGRGEPRP